MKKSIAYFLSIFCLLFTQAANAQQKNTLRYEIMLSSSMLEPSLKKDHFLGAIDISPNKFITLSTGHNFYILGWGGISQFGKEADSTISSFAFASDGLLMAVKNRKLCYMNDKGNLVTLVKLPGSDMGIAAGKDVMYLFDQNRNDKKYKLYAFARGGKYKQLITSPKPVTMVVEMNDSLYLAIGSGVFSFSPKDSKLNLVAGFQKDNEVKSMAVDSANSTLYIATKDAIYAVQNESLVYVTGDFGGGIIKYFKNGLIIFNPETCDIIRIVNIDKSILF
jgi:hypothetical protein